MRDRKSWRANGLHLPVFMRDFHDQKDLFKAIDQIIIHDPNDLRKEITWVDAQIYTIDTFLWFMARYGYTLQKTRTKLEFEDIHKDIEYCRNSRDKLFSDMLLNQS